MAIIYQYHLEVSEAYDTVAASGMWDHDLGTSEGPLLQLHEAWQLLVTGRILLPMVSLTGPK